MAADELGTITVEIGSGTVSVPVYDPATADSPSAFRIQLPERTGFCATAEPSEAEFPQIRFVDGSGLIKALDVIDDSFDVMFVMDSSGSMADSALTAAQQDAEQIMSGLSDTDSEFGYAEFADESRTQVALGASSTTISGSYPSSSGGGTDVGIGLSDAQAEFDANGRSDTPSVIVLQTDTDAEGATAATEFKTSGGFIFTIGYDVGTTDGDPATLASDPETDFAYIDTDDVGTAIPDVIKTL